MKKLLLSLLFIPVNLYAGNVPDSVTSGFVGLVKPSTTTADLTRTPLTKLNADMDIIASSMNLIYTTFSNATMSLVLIGNNTNYANYTTFTNATMSLLLNGNNTNYATSASTTTLNNNLNNYESTADARMSNLSVPISIYDNGVYKGNANTLSFTTNLSITQTGSTSTIVATGSGGGSSVSSTYPIVMAWPGPVFLSTTAPFMSYPISKATITVVGIEAFVGKASSSSATMFRIVYTSAAVGGDPPAYGQYGRTWTPLTNNMIISTMATKMVYTSTSFPLFQDFEVGVLITTTTSPIGSATSGLPPENFKVILHSWKNPNTSY